MRPTAVVVVKRAQKFSMKVLNFDSKAVLRIFAVSAMTITEQLLSNEVRIYINFVSQFRTVTTNDYFQLSGTILNTISVMDLNKNI